MKSLVSVEKIFRQINSLVIYLVNALLSRNFCQKSVRVNSHNFHTVLVQQKIREIDLFCILMMKATFKYPDR